MALRQDGVVIDYHQKFIACAAPLEEFLEIYAC